jgi:hypothetical protein
MKTTLKLLAILAITSLITAGKPSHNPPPLGTWTANQLGRGSVPTTQETGDVVTMEFPLPGARTQAVSFLVESANANLAGKTLSATIDVTYTGNPEFYMAYQSNCSTNTFVRLYFSSPTGPWYADFAFFNMAPGLSGTLTAPVDPTQWSDTNGHLGTYNITAWNNAIANVNQIGFAFGGGCFYDVGVGVVNNSGTATMHVKNLTIQ